MAGFFFTGEQDLTPQALDRKRLLLDALRKENLSAAPVQHWTQALSRVVGSVADTAEEAQLGRTEKAGTEKAKAELMKALGIGGAVSPSEPTAAAGVPASAPAAATTATNSAVGSGQPVNVQPGAPEGTPKIVANNAAPNQLPTMAQQNPSAALIRSFEGYRDKPYWDVNAHRVGYGSDTVTNPDGSVQKVQPGMQITRDQAELDLQRRISTEFQPRAASAVGENWAKLSPQAQAALTSVTYNYGSLPRSVAEAAQSGDPAKIAQAVEGLAGHNGGVNANRRMQEANLIRGGDMPAAGASTAQFNVPGQMPPAAQPANAQVLMAALSNPWAARSPALMQLAASVAGKQLGRDPVEDAMNRLKLKEMMDNQGKPKIETLEINGEKVPARWNQATQQMERVNIAGMSASPPTHTMPDGRNVTLPADPVARKKFLEEMGTAGAKAVEGAPQAVQTANISLNVIDQLAKHPGLPNLFGVYGKLPTMPGGATADAEALLAQIKDRSFLEGIAAMRGTGAITEAEGAKATGAIARLSTNQSPASFKQSLDDLRGILMQARERNATIANNGRPPQSAQQQPAAAGGGWTEIAPGVRIREAR